MIFVIIDKTDRHFFYEGSARVPFFLPFFANPKFYLCQNFFFQKKIDMKSLLLHTPDMQK